MGRKCDIDISWDYYFINLAHHVKIKSPNPKYKVGAVLVSEAKTVTGTGYNDLPKGVNNNIDWCHHETVHNLVVDAEVNCILYADPTADFQTSTLYLSSCPSSHNIKYIATTGLKKIYYDDEYDGCYSELVRKLCNFFNIELIRYRPRDLLVIGTSS